MKIRNFTTPYQPKISEKFGFWIYDALLNKNKLNLFEGIILCKLISLEKYSPEWELDIKVVGEQFGIEQFQFIELLNRLKDKGLIDIPNDFEIKLNKGKINGFAECEIFPGVEPEKVNDYEEFEKQLIICDRMVQTPEFYSYLNRKNKKLAEYFFEELRKGEKETDDFLGDD